MSTTNPKVLFIVLFATNPEAFGLVIDFSLKFAQNKSANSENAIPIDIKFTKISRRLDAIARCVARTIDVDVEVVQCRYIQPASRGFRAMVGL